jgi:nitrogen fixation protein FixH
MNASTRGFTGRHMAAILVAFFAIVVTVNVLMARLAIGTFGGEVVDNSYVASQHFNRWLDEAKAERALRWQALTRRRTDDRLTVTLAGLPAAATAVTAVARHPLGRQPDRNLLFARAGGTSFVSTTSLPPGRWRLRLEVRSGGSHWRHEEDVR